LSAPLVPGGKGSGGLSMHAPMIFSGDVQGVLHVRGGEQGLIAFNQSDLDLLTGLASQAAMALQNARMHAESLKQQRLQQDLLLAEQIQKSFLPRQLPQVEGLEFVTEYGPPTRSAATSEDLFWLIPSVGRVHRRRLARASPRRRPDGAHLERLRLRRGRVVPRARWRASTSCSSASSTTSSSPASTALDKVQASRWRTRAPAAGIWRARGWCAPRAARTAIGIFDDGVRTGRSSSRATRSCCVPTACPRPPTRRAVGFERLELRFVGNPRPNT
jgi:hypothetical protein